MAKLLLGAFCALAIAVAEEAPGYGMRPRPQLSDYAAHETAGNVTLAAEALTADQVGKTFATDLGKGWVVIEAGVYPQTGSVEIDPSAFMLRVGKGDDKRLLRAASPASIAGILQREQSPPQQSDVTLYPSVGVGYETGPGYYDPVTGSRRGGGLRTSVGLGVGIGQAGPPPPASTPADRKTMELELTEKSLPKGSANKAVAGYLYFPRPSGGLKDASLELIYERTDGDLKLELPQPK